MNIPNFFKLFKSAHDTDAESDIDSGELNIVMDGDSVVEKDLTDSGMSLDDDKSDVTKTTL